MMGIFDVFKKKALEEEQEFHRVREEKIKEAVQRMQEEELMSSRYEIVVEFMNMILTDKHNKKSEYLINLLFHQKDHVMVSDYNITRDYYVDKYNKFKDFVDTITEQEASQNFYLFFAKLVYESANSDSLLCMIDLMKLIDTNSKLTMFKERYEFGSLLKDVLPEKVSLSKEVEIDDNGIHSVGNYPVLDDLGIYRQYNNVIDTLTTMVSYIYNLVLWNELGNLKEPISLKTSKLNRIEDTYHFEISFCFENNTKVRRSYIIDKRITRLIGEKCGIPFDDMVNMDPKVLEERLNNPDVKKLVRK